MRSGRPLATGLVALWCLVCSASAAAAYTPSARIELSDRSPSSAPAITSTMTQPQGQSATRAVAARFPAQFTYNPAFAVPGCAVADEQAGSCPPASRLGSMSVRSAFGDAEGPVHLMEDLRLVAFLGAYAGLVEQRAVGRIQVLDDGSFELVFDPLPDIPVTFSQISLDGGTRGMLLTPRRCGTREVRMRFTSHADERVEQVLPIAIEGCPAPVVVRRVRLSGRTLRWRLTAPATTHVTLLRRTGAEWREVRAWRRSGTHLTLPRLPAGVHRLVLRAVAADGRRSRARRVRLTVR